MSANHVSNLERATAAWGEEMPAWVRLLANACDRTSQRQVAERLGKSHPYVNRIVRRDYAGSYKEAETLVRAAYGAEEVDCPVMGEIPLAGCVRNRRRTAAPANHLHRLWAKHCPDCPLNTDALED